MSKIRPFTYFMAGFLFNIAILNLVIDIDEGIVSLVTLLGFIPAVAMIALTELIVYLAETETAPS